MAGHPRPARAINAMLRTMALGTLIVNAFLVRRHQAASCGAAAVPSKTMCRQTLTTSNGAERHRRFYRGLVRSAVCTRASPAVSFAKLRLLPGWFPQRTLTQPLRILVVLVSRLKVRCRIDQASNAEFRMRATSRLRFARAWSTESSWRCPCPATLTGFGSEAAGVRRRT
jgi:hypothetical protein